MVMNRDKRLDGNADDQSRGFAVRELLSPAAYPHAVSGLRLHETHLSWVILTGDFAYKIKKAVHFEYIDTMSLARRLELCREELRLNARLAADLYLDVVPITRDSGGLRIKGSGTVVDYAVCMRQFDSSQELRALLASGDIDVREITALAERIARFHGDAAIAPPSQFFEYTGQMRDAMLGTLSALRSHAVDAAAPAELERLSDWAAQFLHAASERLHLREQTACVRECHGDLHAGNIVRWRGVLTPFDCLEFDPKLRFIDVLNDVAFLVMDLMSHGRDDLGVTFLNRYLECTGDYSGMPLISFYAVYRAVVRAMVDALAIENAARSAPQLRERLRARMRTARELTERTAPLLLLMHGPSGSGKSHFSERLIGPLAAVRVRSDVERKRIGHNDHRVANTGYRQGLYEPGLTNRAYARLLECAQQCIAGGFNTIIDAAFLSHSTRSAFLDLAASSGIQCVILDCKADDWVLEHRLKQRAQDRRDVSDAGPEVLRRQLRDQEPLSDSERASCIEVATSATSALSETLAAIRAVRRPAGV